ncbi:MAG TPA: metallophosphoesterase family protein [Thermoanaerobaculia bacterium]|nr:metallophosphoesterase family protein [Thermoanaerobaculia bacterium]
MPAPGAIEARLAIELPAVRLGILSDTHNLLRPEVLERLAGCDRLLHAGDVGEAGILDHLRRIAPIEAVRGNWDGELESLPATLTGDLDGLPFGMVHRREDIDPRWPKKLRLIVFGHSHRPELEWRGNCLLLNPGACGPRRFSLPLTVAVVHLTQGRLVPEILSVEG